MKAQNLNTYPVDTPNGVLQPGEIGEVDEVPANLVPVSKKKDEK